MFLISLIFEEPTHTVVHRKVLHSDGAMTLSIKGLFATFSITMLCHYAESRILFTIMLNVVMLNVVMLSVVAPL